MKTIKAFIRVLFLLAISIASAQETHIELFSVPLSNPNSPRNSLPAQDFSPRCTDQPIAEPKALALER